jgi:hypothetical protein
MKIKKTIGVLATAAGLLTQGCFLASVAPMLPKVAAVISDAGATLNIIQNVTSSWFAHNPDAELEMQVTEKINSAWAAIRSANAATRGVEGLTQEQYVAAFEDFRTAYRELHELLKKEGLLSGTKLGSGTGRSVDIPEPAALSMRID